MIFVILGAQLAASANDDGDQEQPGTRSGVSVSQRENHASGSVGLNYFRSDNQLNDKTSFFGATLKLKLSSELSGSVNAKVEIRATNPAIVNHDTATVSLTEAYVTVRADPFRVRMGKQIVAWGRTDGINPTDNLTPRDYVALLPFEEDQRFGTNALVVDTFLNDEFSLSLFTTPFFLPSKIPLPLDQAVFIDRLPARRFSNSEFAARLYKGSGRVDWSISYFHGFSLLPNLRPLNLASSVPILALTYPPMDVFGTDFSFNLGRYGIRGEVAYNRMAEKNHPDPLSKKSYWYYVIGGDRTFDDNLNVNIQLFGRFIQDFNNPEFIMNPSVRSIAVVNAIYSGQQDKHSYGVTARVSKAWMNETVKAEILVILNRTRHNAYIRPLLTFDSTDHVKISVGANFYRGADNTFFGRLRSNSGIFAEARYAF